MDKQKLTTLARQALRFSYSPYSKFRVGAAVIGNNGKSYTGTNVENASYGLTICAERVAITKAVSEGVTGFTALSVAVAHKRAAVPCGACLQVFGEFAKNDAVVILCNEDGQTVVETTFGELLTQPFRSIRQDR
ncbi:MAG: cytidine deaminase [Elusimicrobiota bacterium]